MGSPYFPQRWQVGIWTSPCHRRNFAKLDAAHKNRKTSLLACALINLKKTTGGARATDAVEHATARDTIFLREQIELINPQVVVCGGTYKSIKQHLYPTIRRVAPRVHEVGERLFINANHPSYLKKTAEMYDDVVGSYQRYKAALREATV
jgi:uracil-DNA glycosylase